MRLFDDITGSRKLLLALVSILCAVLLDIFAGGISEGAILLIFGVYACFVVGNICEHVAATMMQQKHEPVVVEKPPIEEVAPTPEEPQEEAADPILSKILEYQESSIKALEYIVSFVRKNDPERQSTK